MSDRQVYRCLFFFLSLIMNFFCPPRLALATREPGENCQSSSENLQMLIQVFIPVELSSFSVFSVFDSISSRFSLLYSAREEEILDCGSSSSLLARELKEHKKYSYCFVFVPALEHNTRFALASCTQKKKRVTLVKGRDNGNFSATELFNMLNNYGHHLQGGPHYKSSL